MSDSQPTDDIDPSDAQGDKYAPLNARYHGEQEFLVSNRDTEKVYIVDLDNLGNPDEGKPCTCPSARYHVEQEGDVCKHVLYVLMISRTEPAMEEFSAELLVSAYHDMRGKLADVERELTGLTADMHQASQDIQQAAEEQIDEEQLSKDLHDAWTGAGYDVLLSEFRDGEVHFDLQHGDFEELKRATSQSDLVSYNGEHNVLDVGDARQYIEEVL